jgi:putative holliday junction resolvase
MAVSNRDGNIIALDIGDKRIGVAAASMITGLPRPVTTIIRTPEVFEQLAILLKEQRAESVVIGLPRNLSGEDTPQTNVVRTFGAQLASKIDIPVYWTDEALTSQQAETELKARRRTYDKKDIDSLAACYILNDFLSNNSREAI